MHDAPPTLAEPSLTSQLRRPRHLVNAFEKQVAAPLTASLRPFCFQEKAQETYVGMWMGGAGYEAYEEREARSHKEPCGVLLPVCASQSPRPIPDQNITACHKFLSTPLAMVRLKVNSPYPFKS
jgi:hypothetical protein